MPIVRLAVDWGDGTVDKPNVYQVKGWFKNRKGAGDCNRATFTNGNECVGAPPDCRVRFGDSSDACEDNYYQFTHIYECNKLAGQKCTFVPRVQVLDNWGWCNSSDGNGRWNDDFTDKDDKETERNCYTGSSNQNNPWTSFGGTIEVEK